jgi:ABC-type polysaccharide/polyol phosphate export permease
MRQMDNVISNGPDEARLRRRERARNDLRKLWTDRHIWQSLALKDIQAKYRLSVLGSIWISLSMGITAFTIGLIYGQFFGVNMESYLPYFTAGIIFWTWINMSMNESGGALVNASSLIKASNLPMVFFVMRVVQRNFIIMLHNLIILLLVWLYFQWHLPLISLASLAGAALLFLFLVGAGTIIAFVCVRYRDVQPLVAAATQFLFFATPILWLPEQLKVGRMILMLNPFAYLITVTRDPLLARPVAWEDWAIATLIVAVTLSLAAAMYVRYRDRIAYWI